MAQGIEYQSAYQLSHPTGQLKGQGRIPEKFIQVAIGIDTHRSRTERQQYKLVVDGPAYKKL